MTELTDVKFGRVLRAAALAGLAAGLLAAVFHLALTEPLIDQAIAIEEQMHAPGGAEEDPIVSRSTQRIGLVVGFAIYGVCWGLLLAGAYWLTRRWLPGRPAVQALVLALLGYWALAALPFLKYPANPPGVGDPETIGYRQLLYVVAVAAAAVAAAVSLIVRSQVAVRVRSPQLGWLIAGAVVLLSSGLILFGLPANPDSVPLPADLVAAFRGMSLSGLTLFWLVLGTGFALLLRRVPT